MTTQTAEQLAAWLESQPSIYAGVKDSAAMLRSQAAEIESLKRFNDVVTEGAALAEKELRDEIERLKVDSATLRAVLKWARDYADAFPKDIGEIELHKWADIAHAALGQGHD